MRVELLLLLITPLISGMADDTCFPPTANSGPARPIVLQEKTETERRCKVLCGDNPNCRAVSYIYPNCTLLGAVDNSMKCSDPAVEVFIRQDGGCPQRADITGGIDNPPDKCVKFVPGKTKLGGANGICPRDVNNFVVRGIDEFGFRVTLDNDINNVLTFNATRNLWKFYHASSGFVKYFTSVSCATSTLECPCAELENIKPNLAGGVGPKQEVRGTCVNPTDRINFLGGKDRPGSPSTGYAASEAVQMTITCQAGIWLLNYVDNRNGWQILNATCAP